MKEACYLDLICVECKAGQLSLDAKSYDGSEVIEGNLSCSCGASYPIINGVPRMLKPGLLSEALDEYKRNTSSSERDGNDSENERVKKGTMDAFGFEWRYYDDYEADNYYHWMPEGFVPEKDFSGKTGLEVGCGAGRHAEKTAQWAKTHYGVDLSYAVDSAFNRTRSLDNCHIIQADAFDLPFPEGSFDYVYCLGVIQHMDDPPAGFKMLAKQVRPGGVLLVNAYQSSRPIISGLLEMVRKVTIRMPAPLLNKLCYVAGTIDYAVCKTWKVIEKVGLGRILRPITPERIIEYSKHSFKTIVADWYDRLACPKKFHYSKEDLEGWYRDAGFTNIRVTPYWKAFWNGYGEKAL